MEGQDCFCTLTLLGPQMSLLPPAGMVPLPMEGPLALQRTMCGDFTSPGLPRKTTLAKEGSKVRASQCGITAPGGHPNPAVPCLILRKLFNVSSSSSSWVVAATPTVVPRQADRAPRLAGHRPWWKMMDFLKNLLVSVQGCGGVRVRGPPAWSGRWRWSQGHSCCPWQGVPGGWWPIMGAGKLPVTQGKEEQISGPERTVCGGRPGRPWHRVRGEGLSLAWRSEVGVLARDWAGPPSACLWQGFSALCQRLRGPAARCRLCTGIGRARGRWGGCQGERGRDSAAGLLPGCKHSELVWPALWGCVVPGMGLAVDSVSRVRALGLCGY